MRHAVRDGLNDIPVLDDLAVFEAEDVDAGFTVLRRAIEAAHMDRNHVALDEDPTDLHPEVRITVLEAGKELAQALGPIAGSWIVLDIAGAQMPERGGVVPAIDAALVEIKHHVPIAPLLLGVG